MFDWNCQIFWRINRQIIRVTQTPWKSLCLLSRKKKKNPHIFRVIFYLENLSSNGKISNSCSPCSSLTRIKGLCEALSLWQWSASWLASWPALSPSYLQSPKILHTPPSLTGQPGCFSCMSGLSLGNSGLFNYLASDWSDFSLFSWQPSRIHPSFSFSQRRFWAATAEDQPKAAHWTAVMRGEASTRAVDLWELTLTEHYQSLRKRRRK